MLVQFLGLADIVTKPGVEILVDWNDHEVEGQRFNGILIIEVIHGSGLEIKSQLQCDRRVQAEVS